MVRRYLQTEKNFTKYRPPKKRRSILNFFKKAKKTPYNKNQIYTGINPFKKDKKNYRNLVGLSALCIILLVWLIILIYLPFFRINNIEYNGLKLIKQADVQKIVEENIFSKGVIPNNNYFFIKTKRLDKVLNESFNFDSIEIVKKFPDTLVINFKEKICSIIYDNEDRYVLLDTNGKVLKDLAVVEPSEFLYKLKLLKEVRESSSSIKIVEEIITSSTKPNLDDLKEGEELLKIIHIPNYKKMTLQFEGFPLLYDERKIPVNISDQILSPQIVNAVIEWQSMVIEEGVGKIKYFETENPISGITVINTNAWDIYFNPQNNLEQQFENLKTIIEESSPNEYIDLRFNERVYWK